MIQFEPPAIEARFDWCQVVQAWELELTHLGSPVESDPHFIDLIVPDRGGNRTLRDQVIDWFPADDMEAREAALKDRGVDGIYWNSYAGTVHTAELLWRAQDKEPLLIAVWMAAFARDLKRQYRHRWHGSTVEVIDRLYSLALDEVVRSGSTEWHHATKMALPITLFNSPSSAALLPKEFRHFVMLAVITMNLCRTSWVPVRIMRADTLKMIGERY